MKQLPMTPELSALIKSRVGEDVDTTNLAVFETIALNTKPLPGKRGTFFDSAVTSPLTLAEMVNHINSGNHLPLISDHELAGEPKGRFFHAGLDYSEEGGLDMRALFYLDPTEERSIAKLNAGSLDEVSVSFLAREFNCSECGWDYFAAGEDHHFETRTCENWHTIGVNGVHGNMVGLNQFIELSLVARGAADKPKIVGKSQAKLAPQSLQRLAASGFELDGLVVQASLGTKDDQMDLTAALTKVATLSEEKGTLTAQTATLSADKTRLEGEVTSLKADNVRLTTELSEAKAAQPADYDTIKSENSAAVALLGEQFDHLTVATGGTKVEGDARPKTVAEFKTKIDELTGKLTAILPTGGVSEGLGGKNDKISDSEKERRTAAFSLGRKK